MIAAQIKKSFDPVIELDIKVWENFSKLGEIVEFPAETVLKESGSIEKYFRILLQGTGGILLWGTNNYVCTDLFFESDVAMDYLSFTMQSISEVEVRLFEKSTVFRIPHSSFQRTFAPDAYGVMVSLKSLEAVLLQKRTQQLDLLTKTAKQRYIEALHQHEAISRVPLKYMASYLGITPQSLSRIRAEKL